MDWGAIIQIILAVMGAAAIAGGIIAYRGSKQTGIRAFAASSIAAGAVMWLIVALTVPAYTAGHGAAPPPQIEGIQVGQTALD